MRSILEKVPVYDSFNLDEDHSLWTGKNESNKLKAANLFEILKRQSIKFSFSFAEIKN